LLYFGLRNIATTVYSLKLIKMKARKFWLYLIIALISIGASLFITIHGNYQKGASEYWSPNFFISLITSLVLCLALIWVIYKISARLDCSYDWRKKTKQRLLLQFVLGFLVPAIVDLLIMSVYFELLGTDLFESEFLLIDYVAVILFIVTVNFVFIVYHLLEPVIEIVDQVILTIRSGKAHVDLKASEILYFCLVNRRMEVVVSTGEIFATRESLSNLKFQFNDAGFMQINRSVIINPKIVLGYRKIEQNKIQIIVRPDFINSLQHRPNDVLIVTAEHLENVKKQFNWKRE